MIDNRFQLVPTEHKHLFHLQFLVEMPLPKNYKKSDAMLIIEECQRQYPELKFNYTGLFTAKFPDGQYAKGTVESTTSCHTHLSHVKSIMFSPPMQLDSIMKAVTGFKNAVRPLQFTVNPAELSTITPEDFLEIVSDMYAEIGISIRVQKISWVFNRLDSTNESVYLIQPTEYEYV